MVVVVVMGVVRRHLVDAGGDAPQRLHVRLRGRPTPRPPPFDPPSPPGSHAPSRLSLGARGALALAFGPPSGPHVSVPLPVPWVPPPVTHALACLLADRPSLCSMHLGALPAPLRTLPVPWPFPSSLPCVAPSMLAPLLLAARALACSLRVPLGTSPVASCPPLRAPVAGAQLCLRAVPSFLDHAPGVPLPLQLRQRDTRRRALGRRGADVPRPPRAWPVRGPSPAFVACRGPRRGRPRRWRGSPGAAVATGPRAPSPLPSAAAAALRDAPCSCAGATPRVSGVPGAAVGAAAWLAGAAVSSPRAPGAPSWGGAAGLAVGAAGAVTSAGSGSWVDGLVSAEAVRGCPAGGPTSTAASASHHPSRSAGVSPAPFGETGERERDRRWWRSSRWGEPSEPDITVFLVGMRGGRCALPTTSRCISVVPWAVLCSALQGGGGEGVGGRLCRQHRMGGGRRSSIGIGRGGGGAMRPTRHATAPSLGRGSGPLTTGGRQVVPGGAALGGPP